MRINLIINHDENIAISNLFADLSDSRNHVSHPAGGHPGDSIPPGGGEIIVRRITFPPSPNPGNPGGGRPLAPSRQVISCHYSSGQAEVTFEIPEGTCLMTVSDAARVDKPETYFDSSAPAYFNVGYLTNGYIKISTSQGNVYGGSYFFRE